MPAFIAALLGGLINIAATLAGRVLVALGYSVVMYTGIDTTLTWLKDQAVSSMQGMPADVVGLLAFFKVGTCISIIFSAVMARLLLDSMTGGVIKRLAMR